MARTKQTAHASSEPAVEGGGEDPERRRMLAMMAACKRRRRQGKDDKAGQVNPTYGDARDYVNEYFNRQKELNGLLDEARHSGYENFKIYSGDDYNKDESIDLALFDLALAAVPAASEAMKVFKMEEGGKLVKGMAKLAEHGSEMTESVSKEKEAGEKATEAHDKAGEEGEGAEKGDFEAETNEDMLDNSAENLQQVWEGEDQFRSLLECWKSEDASVDLKQRVVEMLPPQPKIDDLKKLSRSIAEQFELQLYNRFYITEGRASYDANCAGGEAMSRLWHGLPKGVQKRAEQLDGMQLFMANPKRKGHGDDANVCTDDTSGPMRPL